MNKLNCIIIDDEEGAHRVLEHFIGQSNHVKLKGSFYTAIEAMEYLYTHTVDMMFLDINMPGLSGMDMLETMANKPYVILTTAYNEYALEGYKYDVADYMVKPFDFKRFLSSVDKVINRIGSAKRQIVVPSKDHDYIILKVDGEIMKIDFSQILYAQSYGNYVKFYIKEKMLVSQITTQEVESKLDERLFVRVHKSYLVALKEISKIAGGQIFLKNGVILPIGNFYKKNVIDKLEQ